jgi:hypothetical protein
MKITKLVPFDYLVNVMHKIMKDDVNPNNILPWEEICVNGSLTSDTLCE